MERRAVTRQKLFLHAQLVRTGVGILPCTIKNFCPGGLFLTLQGSPVEVDDSIQVLFNCPSDGKDKTFHLRARVAGQFDRGIGREFFKPDQEAIRALQTLADRQHEQSAKTTLPTEASPSNAEALLANCKQGLDNYLAPKLELLFEHAEEALLEEVIAEAVT